MYYVISFIFLLCISVALGCSYTSGGFYDYTDQTTISPVGSVGSWGPLASFGTINLTSTDQGLYQTFRQHNDTPSSYWNTSQLITISDYRSFPVGSSAYYIDAINSKYMVGSSGVSDDPILTFYFNGTMWNVMDYLPSPYNSSYSFGLFLTLSEGAEWLIVTSNPDTTGVVWKVDLYKRVLNGTNLPTTITNTTWSHFQSLTDDTGAPDDAWGSATALYGDTLVVGSANSRTIVIFRFAFNGWLKQSKYFENFSQFGSAIILNQYALVVGASIGNRVFVYLLNENTMLWEKSQNFTDIWSGRFGWTIAQDGVNLAVGAPTSVDGAGGVPNTGFLYTYEFNTTSKQYDFVQTIQTVTGATGEQFAYYLSGGGGSLCFAVSSFNQKVMEFWCTEARDVCGICGGNGSSCQNQTSTTGSTTSGSTTTTTGSTTGASTTSSTTGATTTTGESTTGEVTTTTGDITTTGSSSSDTSTTSTSTTTTGPKPTTGSMTSSGIALTVVLPLFMVTAVVAVIYMSTIGGAAGPMIRRSSGSATTISSTRYSVSRRL